MSLFSSLNTGWSGLNTNQVALSVTSENISNASNPNYTRERAQIVSLNAIHTASGDIGMGSKVQTIIRIKNEFLFNRYEVANKDLSYFKNLQKNMNEIVSYFPDVQDKGMNKDIQNYFDAWNNFANNPNDDSAKVDLASKTQILANTIKETRKKLDNVTKNANKELSSFVDEVNKLIKEIANITKEIRKVEANDINKANILRDKRDEAEKRLVELTGAKIQRNPISINVDSYTSIDYDNEYTISLGGYPIVDNTTYHPLTIKENPKSNSNMYSIYFQKQDHTEVDITQNITNKSIIGSILEFRGTKYDEKGNLIDGISSKYINMLDTFANTLIKATNSIYSYSAQESATGESVFKPISLTDDQINKYVLEDSRVVQSLHNPVRNGGNLVLYAYDNNGKFVKEISTTIDTTKTLADNLTTINNNLNNAGVDYKAVIQNGNIVFQKVDNDGNGSLDNGAILVKDDGARLFDALNDIQYKPIDKTNDLNLPFKLKDGSFDVVTYDSDGNELARRTITVNSQSKDPLYSTIQGILSQINMPNKDDNNNNDSSDDVDDYYSASIDSGKVVFNKKTSDSTYIGLDNDSANFGGVFGINRFFDGYDSKTISLNQRFINNPSELHAYKAPNDGNNDVANDMVQLQYNDLDFTSNDSSITTTISGYYSYITSSIANDSDKVNTNVETQQVIYNSIEKEYQNQSGVNMDEEMTNLMKFQRGYQASAKVITTINAMFDTLLNIKR